MELDKFVFNAGEDKDFKFKEEYIVCDEVRCTADSKAEDIVGQLYILGFYHKDELVAYTIGGEKTVKVLIKRFIDTPAKEVVVFTEGEE